MWKFLPVIIFATIMTFFVERHSVCEVGERGEKRYLKRDKLFFTLLAIGLAVFAGLRTRYNDTGTYRRGYEAYGTTWHELDKIDWSLGANPGFHFVNTILRILGASTQSFLMFYALITVCIYIWFLRKYSNSFGLSIFLFFAGGGYVFTMAAIKQCVAVAICLIATDRAIQKKWGPFVFLVLLACLFHPYALMFLIVPLLRFSPWTKKNYWMIGIFFALGLGLQPFLGTLIDITTMIGEVYTVEEFSGEGVNIFRFLVSAVPLALSFLVRDKLRQNDNRMENIMMNLTMLCAVIMFVALFGTANYFARLANYFALFPVITLPWLFRFFDQRSRKFLAFAMVFFYVIFFHYEMMVAHDFDWQFDRMMLGEYLKTLFNQTGAQ